MWATYGNVTMLNSNDPIFEWAGWSTLSFDKLWVKLQVLHPSVGLIASRKLTVSPPEDGPVSQKKRSSLTYHFSGPYVSLREVYPDESTKGFSVFSLQTIRLATMEVKEQKL